MTVRATADIYAAPGVLAFRKGDVVPDSVAKLPEVKDKVASEKTKAVETAVKDRIKEG